MQLSGLILVSGKASRGATHTIFLHFSPVLFTRLSTQLFGCTFTVIFSYNNSITSFTLLDDIRQNLLPVILQ